MIAYNTVKNQLYQLTRQLKQPYWNTRQLNSYTVCTIGWVNLYQKFEIEKYTVCGKLILPQKMKRDLF